MYRWDDRHDCIESHRTRQSYPVLLVKLVLHFHPNSFGFDIDFEADKMMYIFYGSLAVLLWKCGSQLLKEVKYKNAAEEEELKKKERLTKGTKYSKVFY